MLDNNIIYIKFIEQFGIRSVLQYRASSLSEYYK